MQCQIQNSSITPAEISKLGGWGEALNPERGAPNSHPPVPFSLWKFLPYLNFNILRRGTVHTRTHTHARVKCFKQTREEKEGEVMFPKYRQRLISRGETGPEGGNHEPLNWQFFSIKFPRWGKNWRTFVVHRGCNELKLGASIFWTFISPSRKKESV